MYDAMQRATGHGVRRRLRKRQNSRFSPSYGVHKGLITDPNWPPPEFPEEGTAAARRTKRFSCDFEVHLGAESFAVHGDISLGGAMFLLGRRLDAQRVVVTYKRLQAVAELVSTSTRGKQTAHHFRFLSRSEAQPLAAAVEADS